MWILNRKNKNASEEERSAVHLINFFFLLHFIICLNVSLCNFPLRSYILDTGNTPRTPPCSLSSGPGRYRVDLFITMLAGPDQTSTRRYMLSRFRGLLVRERPSLDRVVAGKRTVKLGKRSYITGQYFHNFSSRFIFLLLFFFSISAEPLGSSQLYFQTCETRTLTSFAISGALMHIIWSLYIDLIQFFMTPPPSIITCLFFRDWNLLDLDPS